ncbi:MAG: ABC transporter permease [Bryobacterales bacterium]|nr:ABC transporter permease [Bryobacterales bacterium]
MNGDPRQPDAIRVLRAITADTIREAFAQHLVWAIYGSTALILLFLLFVLEIDIVRGAKATISLFGQEAMSTASNESLMVFLREVQGAIAVFLYGVSTFVAVFVCAGLTPALYERGRADLTLTRPISRFWLVLGCYLGNVTMVALNVALLIGGSYVILGWKSGYWAPGFLYAVPITCFVFSVLMALVMLVSISTESSAAATIAAFLVLLFSPILAQKELAVRLLGSEAARGVWRGLHAIIPRTYELGAMIIGLLRGQWVSSWEPVLASAAFGALCLVASVILFVRKDC